MRNAVAIGVLALAGALIAAPAAGAAGVRTVSAGGVVKVGMVHCAASEACAVKPRPKRIAGKAEGRKVKARVVVPSVLGPGGKAPVKLRFGAGALERLAGHSTSFHARVLVKGSGRQSMQVFKVTLKRPDLAPKSATPGGSVPKAPGGNGAPNGEGAHSEPVSGEAPPLARPLTARTVERVGIKWFPRTSWLAYVATGEGTTTTGGATSVFSTVAPCPAQPGSNEGGGSSSGVSLPFEIDFTPTESWFDPATGAAAINGTGSVSFRFKGHGIDLTGSDPEIQINGASSQAVFRFSGSEGTPYPDQRVALLKLATTAPTQEGNTYTYNLLRATLTPDGEKVFAGFYAAPTNNGFGCVSASFTVP
ncbi:MAG: HtaA domain-containing protein [Actinobacteria bacterium]|nr:HtaA domain-containing protein [Actinomycetota bacterium]